MATGRFHWTDYVVTVVMLCVSLGIGFFFALFKGGQKTKIEYLLGNREMNLGPVCLSLFVTFQSAISLIGIPSDVYNTGSMIIYVFVGLALAYTVGYFTVIPLFYPLHLTSVYEYLNMRFQSKAVRLLGTCIGMLQTMLYMAVALFSPALALQAAAGLPLWVSVAIVGGIGTIYTAVGGIKSVVWTDAFQTVIVFIGIAAVIVKGVMTVGSFSRMFDIATDGGRIDFAVVNPDPRERHSMWSGIIGACFMWLVNCFNQSTIQRIGSLKTMKAAKIAFILNAPLNIFYGASLTVTGILLYAYVITIGCDPYQAGMINNKNQMMPYFVIHVLDDLPGMAGLYMSMLFSGALSTVSSGINALAANTVEDLLARPLRGVKDTTVTVIAKLFVVLYGAVCIGLSYVLKSLEGPVTQMGVTAFGACGGPVVGMFILGGAFPWGNKYGAFGGGIIGLVINMWIAVGSRLYGAPTASLPPGPTHNCNFDNTSLPVNLNSSFADVTVSYVTMKTSFNGSGIGSGVSSFGYNVTAAMMETTITHASVERPFSIYDISYLWFGTIGIFVSFFSGIIISFVTGCRDPKTLDPRLIFPFCRKIYRMPEPVLGPDDISNVVAMKIALDLPDCLLGFSSLFSGCGDQRGCGSLCPVAEHYRQSWEVYKKRGIDTVRLDDYKEQPHGLGSENKESERLTVLTPNGSDAD